MKIKTKRIYEEPSADDGLRILVDRLWPRGVRKADAALDLWAKELAPSHVLRKWFDHDETKRAEFEERYVAELATQLEEAEKIADLAEGQTITLLYAAKSESCNHAVMLREWLIKIQSNGE